MIVPKYRHTAVARNRLKRRLRELLRLELLPVLHALSTPFDVVVRAHPPAYDRSWPDLAREMRQAARRIADTAAA